MLFAFWISYFFVGLTKYGGKHRNQGRVYFGSQLKSTVYHGEVMVAGAIVKWSSYSYCQEAEKDGRQCSACFLLCVLKSRGFCHPQPGWVFLPLLTQFRNALACMPRGCLRHDLSFCWQPIFNITCLSSSIIGISSSSTVIMTMISISFTVTIILRTRLWVTMYRMQAWEPTHWGLNTASSTSSTSVNSCKFWCSMSQFS